MSSLSLPRKEIALHWMVALGMVGMTGMGLYMTNNDAWQLMPLHKSVGALLFLVILWRVGTRLVRGWPAAVGQHPAWQRRLARTMHWVLILGTVLLPLSGLMISIGGGRGLAVFGAQLLPANLGADGKPQAIAPALAAVGEWLHVVGVKVVIAAFALHVVGALKHHLVDRDGSLRRMLGRGVPDVKRAAATH